MPEELSTQNLAERYGKIGHRGRTPRMRKVLGSLFGHPSTTGHVKPCGNLGGPSPKAKYNLATDRVQYREGKVKRTPFRGVKST